MTANECGVSFLVYEDTGKLIVIMVVTVCVYSKPLNCILYANFMLHELHLELL